MTVTWEDPPHVEAKPGSNWYNDNPVRGADTAVEELRDHPGKWGVVKVFEPAKRKNARSYKRRYLRYYPDCEFVVRVVDGTTKLYGRVRTEDTD